MALPWVRLDTSFFDHPKVLQLMEDRKHRAIVTHLAALTYSGKHGLDGFVPKPALRIFGGTVDDTKSLVEQDLWHVSKGGWEINGWLEYQFSTNENQARKEKATERGKKAACVRHHGASCGCWADA
jgi:hypothetical protein